MHTTASSLVAIAQYFQWIRTSVLYGNQQKFNIEAVNDYLPIRFEVRFKRKFPIRRSLPYSYVMDTDSLPSLITWHGGNEKLPDPDMLFSHSWI